MLCKEKEKMLGIVLLQLEALACVPVVGPTLA